jgi:hypothetical protein
LVPATTVRAIAGAAGGVCAAAATVGETLVERNVGRGRLPAESGTPDYFKKQDALMRSIYNPKLIVKTDNRAIGEIAKQLVRHALFNEYEPTDFAPIVERYR